MKDRLRRIKEKLSSLKVLLGVTGGLYLLAMIILVYVYAFKSKPLLVYFHYDKPSYELNNPDKNPDYTIRVSFSHDVISKKEYANPSSFNIKSYLKITPEVKYSVSLNSRRQIVISLLILSLNPNTGFKISVNTENPKLKDISGNDSIEIFYRRYALVASNINSGEVIKTLNKDIYMIFNYPAKIEELKKYLTVKKTAKDTKHDITIQRYYGRLSNPDGTMMSLNYYGNFYHNSDYIMKNLNRYYVYKIRAYNLSVETFYRLEIDKSLTPETGGLSLEKNIFIKFETYARFKVLNYENQENYPETPFEIQLNNNFIFNKTLIRQAIKVINSKTKKAVKITKIEGTQGYSYSYGSSSKRIKLYFQTLPREEYIIKIAGNLRDEYNQVIKPATLNLTIKDYKPYLSTPLPTKGIFESKGKIFKFPLAFINLKGLKIKIKAYHGPLKHVGKIASKTDEIIIEKSQMQVNVRKTLFIDLKKYLNDNKGFIKIEVEAANQNGEFSGGRASYSPDRGYREFFYQFTDLSVTTKYSPKNIFVYVTNLSDPKPVKNSKISIFSKSAGSDRYEDVYNGYTNQEGYIIINNTHSAFNKLYKRFKRGFESRTYYTDNSSASESEPDFVVIAEKDGDFTELNFNSNTSIDLSNTSVDNTTNAMSKFHAFIFTPKGLYKKKETVLIKGYVRENKNGRIYTAADKKYLLKVVSPDNSTVLEKKIKTNPFGSFHVEYELPDNPELGKYVISLSSDDADDNISYENKVFNGSFMVEAYRARNFEISLKAGQKDRTYYSGDAISFYLTGKYLYGGLMANAKVKYRIDAYPFDFNNFKFAHMGYRFSSLSWFEHGSNNETDLSQTSTTVEQAREASLNGAGRFFGRFTARVPFNNSAVYKVIAEVEDADRQSVVSTSSVTVHKSRFYIGYKCDKFFLKTGEPLNVNVVSAKPEGSTAGAKPVTIRFYRVEWKNVRKLAASGYYKWDSIKEYKYQGQISALTSGNHSRPKIVSYKPLLPGTYIATLESKDSRGNRIKNMLKFWVYGEQYTTWQMSDNQSIELVRDKSFYKPGDYARIMVKSPYKKVKALITVEREGVIDSFTTDINNTAGIIKVKIKESYGSNVFVSVMLLQGRVGSEYPVSSLRDIYKPTVKIGYTVLYIDQSRKQLNIDIKGLKRNYEPRNKVNFKIKVTDYLKSGVKTEVGVYVVDEGVLSLIGYKTPNPFYAFHRNRELMVKTADSRLEVVGQHKYSLKGESPGGSGKGDYDIRSSLGLSNVSARNIFKAIAYSNPAVETDSNGYVSISFNLPDNLTKYRVMVIAADKTDKFSAIHTHIKVSKPLIARPALPRFLNYKDRLNAGVVVINNQDKGVYATVSVGTKNIKRHGINTKRVYVPANASKEVRFDFEANKLGNVEFRFGVVAYSQGKKLSDVVDAKIPVNMPFYVTRTILMANTVRNYEEHSFTTPNDYEADTLGVEAIASSTALSKLKGSVEYLFGYPYGCLEQKMTRIMPMLLAGKLVKEFKLKVSVPYRELVQKYINELYKYQTSSGGFSIWPEPRYQYNASPYVTAYVLYIMHMGKTQGYKIDSDIRDKTVKYLKAYLSGSNNSNDNYYSSGYRSATNIFIYYILSELREAEDSYADSFIRNIDDLPLYVRNILAKALYNVDRRQYKYAINRILKSIKSSINYEGHAKSYITTNYKKYGYYRQMYLSDIKTTASAILTLLKVDKNNAEVPKLIRGLMARMKNGRYRTTQENMYAIWALLGYFEAYENIVPNFKARVLAEAKQLLSAVFRGRSVNTQSGKVFLFGLNRNTVKVKIFKEGKGRLYYTLRFNYVPKHFISNFDKGFNVKKEIYDTATGYKVENGIFRAGRTYKVELVINVGDTRHDVVIDDPLAAGFEALNPRLAASSLASVSNNNSSLSWQLGFNRVAIKDDRVCLFATSLSPGKYKYTYNMKATSIGTFIMYPTKAEEMYDPDICGYSSSRTIRIR